MCVDSSIFLAEVFGNETQSTRIGAIDKYQKIFEFKKYMSETVKKEVNNRLSEIIILIEQISKDFINEFYLSKRVKLAIDLSDLTVIQVFFSNLKEKYKLKSSELEIINNMESVLVQYLIENYSKKKRLSIEEFVLKSTVEFNKKLTRIKCDYYSKSKGYKVFFS